MNAKKLPSGSWRCRAYDNTTKKTKSFTASTKKEAEYLANEWLTGRKKLPLSDKCLGDCIDNYIDSKSNILAPSTVDKYRNIRKNQLSEQILSTKLRDIDTLVLQHEINRLAGKYSAKTVHNAAGLISSVLHTFYPDTRFNITLPKIQKRTRALPTAAEVWAVWHNVAEMRLVVLLGMWLGLRMSEIRGLKKSDLRGGRLYIDRTITTVAGENIERDQTKTVDSRRSIEIPSLISDMINELSGERITMLSGGAIYKRFTRRMEKFGYSGVTFHDLRHVNASVMLQLGIPDKYAMERGGWSTTTTLKRVYQETYTDERRTVDIKIDNYFDDVCKNVATKFATNFSKRDNKAS